MQFCAKGGQKGVEEVLYDKLSAVALGREAIDDKVKVKPHRCNEVKDRTYYKLTITTIK